MRVLVTTASKYGATTEIAEAIGRVLSERGIDTTVVAWVFHQPMKPWMLQRGPHRSMVCIAAPPRE